AVADDQLALATADRHHRVDRLQTGLHRLRDGLTGDDARRDLFDLVGELGVDRALAVDRLTQRIHDAADQLGADGHFENAAGGLDDVAFGDVLVFTEHHGADGVTLEVERHTEGVTGEFQHFALHDVGQAVDTGDAVGDGDHRALVTRRGGELQVLDPALDQVTDFRGVELHRH